MARGEVNIYIALKLIVNIERTRLLHDISRTCTLTHMFACYDVFFLFVCLQRTQLVLPLFFDRYLAGNLAASPVLPWCLHVMFFIFNCIQRARSYMYACDSLFADLGGLISAVLYHFAVLCPFVVFCPRESDFHLHSKDPIVRVRLRPFLSDLGLLVR